ncbi:potassium channel family protein [Nocardia cyriacigeorgica]|uniref:potassium channel family protein n=1 Tax=Nocardia cyriacigeorgica TaxID=135487 RepID=UPI001032B66A|nr:potassium channel family protein [Nocardia cyriacigeorgica]
MSPVLRRWPSTRVTDAPFRVAGIVRIPRHARSPARAIGVRIGSAIAALGLAVVVVYLDRDGYTDAVDGQVSLLDSMYYATVSLSTTGYGDIVPLTDRARVVNTFVVTPLRVFFLIVLVGTTLAALTENSRQAFRIQRWRSRIRDHTVVIGYGTKGRAAVHAILGDRAEPALIVVDTDAAALEIASGQGLVTLRGSATTADVLRLAAVQRCRAVVVATDRDDTAMLITLAARRLTSTAEIIVAVRETDNVELLRRSGADTVVASSATAGRLLGLATTKPKAVELMEDLLVPEAGVVLTQRPARPQEIGRDPRELADVVLSLVRDGRPHRVDTPETRAIQPGDHLIYLRGTNDSGT